MHHLILDLVWVIISGAGVVQIIAIVMLCLRAIIIQTTLLPLLLTIILLMMIIGIAKEVEIMQKMR